MTNLSESQERLLKFSFKKCNAIFFKRKKKIPAAVLARSTNCGEILKKDMDWYMICRFFIFILFFFYLFGVGYKKSVKMMINCLRNTILQNVAQRLTFYCKILWLMPLPKFIIEFYLKLKTCIYSMIINVCSHHASL